MNLTNDELHRLVETIWSTQLGLDLERADSEGAEIKLAARESVVIGVEITGDFTGILVQRCSQRVALLAARTAFADRGDELAAGDARDVLSELAHMTAGNLKKYLPGQCAVSLPAEVEGAGGQVESEACFWLENEPLIVTLRWS
jgi:CheY-specific phosphatase CheX